jgi:hypothetical protein
MKEVVWCSVSRPRAQGDLLFAARRFLYPAIPLALKLFLCVERGTRQRENREHASGKSATHKIVEPPP